MQGYMLLTEDVNCSRKFEKLCFFTALHLQEDIR